MILMNILRMKNYILSLRKMLRNIILYIDVHCLMYHFFRNNVNNRFHLDFTLHLIDIENSKI